MSVLTEQAQSPVASVPLAGGAAHDGIEHDSRDILFVAMENWDGMWRRNQPIAAGFARRRPDRKVLFVGLPLDVSHLIRRRRFRELWRQLLSAGALPSPPGLPNIFIFNPIKFLPNTLAVGRLFNRWHERRQLRRVARKLGISQPMLWVNPYYAVHLLGRMGESMSIYDVGDDWTSFKQEEWLRQLVIAEDNEFTRRADAVIVVSNRLLEMKRNINQRVIHIPNGVYAERYARVRERAGEPHPLSRGWSGPVLAYTGTVHEDRVDLDMVIHLARRFEQGTLALIGPVQVSEAARARLEAQPNIHMTGPVPFEQMPHLMSAIDVCIVPHVVSDFTESLSPLKLFEYLASGLPTVSTPVSGFRDYPELIYLAKTPDAFADAIEQALREAPEMGLRRQEAARPLTWEARMDSIQQVIDDVARTKLPIGTTHAPASV